MQCITPVSIFSGSSGVCKCSPRFAGSYCLSTKHDFTTVRSASQIANRGSIFDVVSLPFLPKILFGGLMLLGLSTLLILRVVVKQKREATTTSWRESGGGELLLPSR